MNNNQNFLKVTAVFFVFYLICAGYYFKRIYQPWGTCDTDFTVFTEAAQRLTQKQDIYQLSGLETGRDYYKYSPAFALAMVPLSKLHKHLAVPIWYLSIFIFFMGAVFFTQKVLQGGAQKALSKTFYCLAILLSLRFLLSVVQRVQSDCLVLFLLALFIFALFRQKEGLAGVALATAAMVKLTPLIFLPYLLWRRKFKAILACGGAILVYLFAPAVYLGSSLNLEYLKHWFLVHRNNPLEYILWYKNQSLLSVLSRLLAKESAIGILRLELSQVWIVFAVMAAALSGLVFFSCRRNRFGQSGPAYLTEIALVLLCMLLFSPLAWKHTFVHLLIPHLALLYYVLYVNPADKLTRALLIASFIMNTVLNPELTKPFAETVQLYSNITLGTLILYAALLRVAVKPTTLPHPGGVEIGYKP